MTPTLEQIVAWSLAALLAAGVLAAILEVVFGVSFSLPDSHPGPLAWIFERFLVGNPSTPQRPSGPHIDEFVAWSPEFTADPYATVYHVRDGEHEYWTADRNAAPHYTQSASGELTGTYITGVGVEAQAARETLDAAEIARRWNEQK